MNNIVRAWAFMTQFKMKKKAQFTVRGIFFISILLIILITLPPAQAIFMNNSQYYREVALNKKGITYDLSILDRYNETDGSVFILTIEASDNGPFLGAPGIITEEVNGPEPGIEPEPGGDIPFSLFWDPGTYYIYRSHYEEDLAVIVFETLNPFVNDEKILAVNLVIPTEVEFLVEEWGKMSLELNQSIEDHEAIDNYLVANGYNKSNESGRIDENQTFLVYGKDDNIINIISFTGNISQNDSSLDPDNGPLRVPPPTMIIIEGPINEYNESADAILLGILGLMNLSAKELDNADRATFDTTTEIIIPISSFEPAELNWSNALKTELHWLRNESVIMNLTDDDINKISVILKNYTFLGSPIVNSGEDWAPDPREFGPFDAKEVRVDWLPKDSPGLPGRQDEPKPYNYTLISVISVIILGVILSSFGYSRLKRRSILDNLNRKNIFELVKGNQGIHFKKILRELDFKPGALSYHLNVLEKEEYIKSIQDGNLRRFYLFGTKSDLKIALTSIQLRILSIVDERPGITQSGISKSIGTNRMLVNYHIKILIDAGILSLERSGRESHCFTTDNAEYYLAG
jgi:DNA-binding MarR family transcriptional regulator